MKRPKDLLLFIKTDMRIYIQVLSISKWSIYFLAITFYPLPMTNKISHGFDMCLVENSF
jgi:hypothetical protein